MFNEAWPGLFALNGIVDKLWFLARKSEMPTSTYLV